MLELFWTPAPDSPEIRAAVLAHEGRWRELLLKPTHVLQSSARGPILLSLFAIGCAALSAVLPLDAGVGLIVDRSVISGIVIASGLLALVAFIASRIQTLPARAVQHAALLSLLTLLAIAAMRVVWSTFGRGPLAAVLIVVYALVLLVGFLNVFKTWRQRVVAALAEVDLPRHSLSGASIAAVAIASIVFVAVKVLFAAGPEVATDVVSALICCVICYVVAWIFSLGALSAARLLIALNMLK
jgi:hypothetical protein